MADQREFKIGVLAGDGIGPEITDAAIEVLHAATERTGLKLRLTHCLVGWKAREQEGTLLSEATEQTLRASDGWIMGPSPASTRRMTTQTVIPAAIYAGYSSCSPMYVRCGHGRSWTR
jgi:isocitrate/isopropylmalate dehydrogenase